jgi:hypothetical protein
MTSEAEYARLVSLGALRPAIRALVDARDLLASTDNPAADRLQVAAREAALAEQELMGHDLDDEEDTPA